MSSTIRKKTSKKAGRTARGKPKPKGSKLELVNRLLLTVESRLAKDELKATLGDFIRLLQLQKVLETEQPREIEVRWVEPEPANANAE